MTQYYIQEGFLFRKQDQKDTLGLFNLNKLIKRELANQHVTTFDTCCDDAVIEAGGPFPVRANDGNLEYFNGTDWVELAGGGGSVATGITAFATGGQTSATALTSGFNELTTVATAGDSVKLPTAVASTTVIVKNEGAAAADVFPFLADTINDGAANAAYSIAPGATIVFTAVNSTNWETNNQIIAAGDGAVALPSLTFSTQPNMGLYKVSSTQLGTSVSGALVGGWNVSGLFTGAITEQVSGSGIQLSKPIIRQAGTAKAVNTTGAVTAAELAGGLITSTSAAAVSVTLPTAALLATQLSAVRGTQFEFIVDNSVGANTVTVVVALGITVGTTALTGGDSLTISTAQSVGVFRLVFTSATTAILRRVV